MTGKEFMDGVRKRATDDGMTVKECNKLESTLRGEAIYAFIQMYIRYGWLVNDKYGVDSGFDVKLIRRANVASESEIEFIYWDDCGKETSSCFRVRADEVAKWIDGDFSDSDSYVKNRISSSLAESVECDRRMIEHREKSIEQCEAVIARMADPSYSTAELIAEYNKIVEDAV